VLRWLLRQAVLCYYTLVFAEDEGVSLSICLAHFNCNGGANGIMSVNDARYAPSVMLLLFFGSGQGIEHDPIGVMFAVLVLGLFLLVPC